MIYKAENKVQELFDKATKRKMTHVGRPTEVFGRRLEAEVEGSIYFLFDNGKILIKQSVAGTDDSDKLELYRELCNFLLDAINEIE